MSIDKSGRRPIEIISPLLKGATCVISVGLRKEWAKKPSYWIELFAKPLGPKKRSHLLQIARQWSFYRRTTQERIEDQYVMSHDYTSVNNATDSMLEYIKIRVKDKDELVDYVSFADNWEDPALDLKTKLFAEGKLPAREKKTAAERFKESVAERTKNAKW